jgi:DtxR family Mn-dependent transcriptional regulator
MVRRLADQGLLAHERYRGVRLTASGRRAALRTIRRHRVIEAYLSQALGYPWDRVHAEAERLEHAASDELIDRMAAAIGEPEVDPHGAPIPTREGAVDERRLLSLAELSVDRRARILRVSDEDGEMLRYLAGMDIVPGVEVVVEGREPFGGPISLRVGTQLRSLGPELATHIRVEELAEPTTPKK